MDFPKILPSTAIKKFTFAENLYGKISSIIIFSSPLFHKLSSFYSFYN